MSESRETVLREAVAAFNDPDRRDQYLNLYASDAILHGYPGDAQGREGARRFYSQLWEAFPDIRLEVDEIIESGDSVVARFSLAGLQEDVFFGAPVTGRRTQIDGIAWLRFRDHEAVEEWQASGSLDLLTRFAARAAQATTRQSAAAAAAALRWEEQHPDE